MDLERLETLLRTRKPGLMDAAGRYAVLVPLVEREGKLHLLYEVRARSMKRQPGEVCFPGGRMEPGEDPVACALRETQEELGIPVSAVRVLGELDFIGNRSNFIMYPVLGLVEEGAATNMRPNPAEVEETFLVPLEHLMKGPELEYEYRLRPEFGPEFPFEQLGIPRTYAWREGWENGPAYPWEGHVIWGLTGRITRHLIALMGTNQG